MKKYILTILISLMVGALLSDYMMKQYDNNFNILPVFGSQSEEVYLIQQGVYSSFESMEANTSNLESYIYNMIDNMYYVYIGISMEIDNVTKIQNYYKENGINTIIKTTDISDTDFLAELNNYDLILSETDDSETILQICKQILSKYKGG